MLTIFLEKSRNSAIYWMTTSNLDIEKWAKWIWPYAFLLASTICQRKSIQNRSRSLQEFLRTFSGIFSQYVRSGFRSPSQLDIRKRCQPSSFDLRGWLLKDHKVVPRPGWFMAPSLKTIVGIFLLAGFY